MGTLHEWVPSRIIIESLVHRFHHQVTGVDLKGARHTYDLAETDADVQLANTVIHSDWRKADDHMLWLRIINTPTLQ